MWVAGTHALSHYCFLPGCALVGRGVRSRDGTQTLPCTSPGPPGGICIAAPNAGPALRVSQLEQSLSVCLRKGRSDFPKILTSLPPHCCLSLQKTVYCAWGTADPKRKNPRGFQSFISNLQNTERYILKWKPVSGTFHCLH